jgi:hypothetical protein
VRQNTPAPFNKPGEPENSIKKQGRKLLNVPALLENLHRDGEELLFNYLGE